MGREFLVVVALLLTATASCSDRPALPPPNIAPIAVVGDSQTVNEGAEVSLSGAGSVDPDGAISAYSWSQTSGPGVVIANANARDAAFVAPSVDADQTLTFRLTITDRQGATASASVNVSVRPIANVVGTTSGFFEGAPAGGTTRFLGIRFAASPVTEARWKAPVRQPFQSGIIPATTFGFICTQPGQLAGLVENEDCLNLNIWTPSPAQTASLPVMVWIHGGGLLTGSGSQSLFDSAAFAAAGNVVVVTINYRMGPLGFLAHPALSQESGVGSSGNYGLLDMIEALRWIRDNIRGFGGDPARVTIFGESAGGFSVCALSAAPVADGLFHRAIMQSGACAENLMTLTQPDANPRDSGEKQGLRAQNALSCSGAADALACMRAKSPDEILTALSPSSDFIFRSGGEVYSFVIDGVALREQPIQAVRLGRGAAAPHMVGTNANEIALFRSAYLTQVQTVSGYQNFVERFDNDANSTLDEPSTSLLSLYPAVADAEALAAFERLYTDYIFVCPARRTAFALAAAGRPAFLYQFTRVAPGFTTLGAFHFVEVPYLFGPLPPPTYAAADLAVSDAMRAYWAAFAAQGAPLAAGQPTWPPYGPSDEHLVLDWPISSSANLRKATCDSLDTLLPPPI